MLSRWWSAAVDDDGTVHIFTTFVALFTDRRLESEPRREQTDQNQRTESDGTVQEKQRTDHNQHERYGIGGDQNRCIDRLGRPRIFRSFRTVEIQRWDLEESSIFLLIIKRE